MKLSQLNDAEVYHLTDEQKTALVYDYPRNEGDGEGDVALLLGGTLENSVERAAAAEVLWKFGKVKYIVACGGVTRNVRGESMTEAAYMASVLRDHGVPEEAIILEEESRTTIENMLFGGLTIVRRLGYRKEWRVCIVTSAWHVRRSLALAKTYLPRYFSISGQPSLSLDCSRDNWHSSEAARLTVENEVSLLKRLIDAKIIDDIEIDTPIGVTGEYIETLGHKYHLQGITTDGEYMYWSCTDTLLKTTIGGSPRVQTEIIGGHLGDCDYYEGKIYASYLGNALPGHPWGDWTSFYIYVFNAKDLALIDRIKLDICYKFWEEKNSPDDVRGFGGVDGITVAPDPESGEPKLFLACGLVPDAKYKADRILKFSMSGEYEGEYEFPIGNTDLGIQNLDYDASRGEFWFTTYGKRLDFQTEETLYRVSGDLSRVIRSYRFPTAVGLHCLGDGEFWATTQWGVKWKKGALAYRCNEKFFESYKDEAEITDFIKKIGM